MKCKFVICFPILLAILSSAIFAYGINPCNMTDGFGVISAGDATSFVIKSDNSLWAWGRNHVGQLGDGTTTDRHTPVWIMDDVIAVSSGGFHTAVIRSDGSLWIWGSNSHGVIGDGTTENRHSPVKIMDDVVAVSASGAATMAIQSDGSLWAWGLIRLEGDLGRDLSSYTPLKIMEDVVAVSANGEHVMIIKSDGSLWGWGTNISGELGDGTTGTRRQIPIKIMEDVVAVSAETRGRTKAIRADGSLWAWGANNFGILGNDSVAERYLYPVKIMDEVVSVSTSSNHTVAVRTDGSLWVWGANWALRSDNPWLVDGFPFPHIPTMIMGNVAVASAGGIGWIGRETHHTIVLRTDGSLWTFGENEDGQLGDGTIARRNEPVKIMDGVMLPNNMEPVAALPPPIIPVDVLVDDVPRFTTATAYPVTDTIVVNGEDVIFQVYRIYGLNFYSIREFAYILSGTSAQINVVWDDENSAIVITTGQPYENIGGERVNTSSEAKTAQRAVAAVFLNDTELQLIAFNIGGNNFFSLTDIVENLDLFVDWCDEIDNIVINTPDFR
ncbi:MAG: hypothetical protein FWB80_11230 [Defluviitaleaceae bacterium]|nr:hypothetical protein [Defluviitaleaceae bacterium]